MQTRRSRTRGSIVSEGGLVPPGVLDRVRAGDKDLPGMGEQAYHLDDGQRLDEATTSSWNRLLGAWETFRGELSDVDPEEPATTITRERFLLPLFEELGYGRLQTTRAVEIEGRSYPVSHAWADVPIHLVGANVPLDRRTQRVKGAAGQSPHGLLQELLNRSDERLWGFVSNGRVLRLLRDNVSLTRQAYLEFDLESIMDGEDYADFVLLWLVCHQSRVEGDRPESYLLEQLRTAAATSGTRALDRLREGVERAIEILGQGFLAHPANDALRDRVRSGELTGQDYYRELLRVVYRLIFLFVAEDRDALLHPDSDDEARDRYERGYSATRLRQLANQRRGSRHGDLWRSLVVVVGALGGTEGAPSVGLPALGGFLFSRDACPDLDGAQLSNRDLLTVIRSLATIEDGGVSIAVDYRNLGSEELGSIYESLLAYHPELHPDAATFELHSAAGSEKKTTGSYYTPTSLINELLDSALEPVLAEAVADRSPEAAEQAILDLKVVDPAVGSGHFLVGAAHRIGRKLASVRTGDEEPAPEAMRTALRDIVGRCLYGVDINPDAAELCRVSLWMEALEPGRPLSFLDSHIRVGNSLLGTAPALLAAGIPDEAYAPISGDDKKAVTGLRKHNKAEREGQLGLDEALIEALDATLGSEAADISAMPEDDVAAVAARSQRDQSLRASPAFIESKLLADAWCAGFVVEKWAGAPTITTGTLRRIARDPSGLPTKTLATIATLAEEYQLFHWHLEFPDVFNAPDGDLDDTTGWTGGFDVVLANPPWERLKLQEKEFFAVRAPEIAAAPNAAKRKKMIAALEHEDPDLFAEYQAALRRADGESHIVRNGGRYPLCGRGDINTYSIFAESMRGLVSRHGRVGCIVPTGIATDATTQFFFRDLVERGALWTFFGFRNERHLFAPPVDHRVAFALVTMLGRSGVAPQPEFCFDVWTIEEMRDPARRYALTDDDFALLNPNTRTLPTFRTRRDAEITEGIYRRVPVLVDEAKGEAGNLWGISFMAMLHMAGDSHLFHTEPGPGRVPLYEAKMVHHYNHRWATYEDGEARDVTEAELRDPSFSVTPRYWVDETEVDARLADRWDRGWLLGWRNVTGSTNSRTLIANVMPRCGAGHSMPIALLNAPERAPLIYANLCSFALDYVVRQKLGGPNLTFFVVNQLPVLPPSLYEQPCPWDLAVSLEWWIGSRSVALTYSMEEMRGYAIDHAFSGPPFKWDPEARELMEAELDAAYLYLYGIGQHDADYILDTFLVVRDRDTAKHGEYRTKRLILECYDDMATAIAGGEPYVSPLKPAPGTGPGWGGAGPPAAPPNAVTASPARHDMTEPGHAASSRIGATRPAMRTRRWVPESDINPAEIRPGSTVRHRVFGEGQVVSVQSGLSPVLTIDFGDEAKLIIYGRGLLEIGVSDEGEIE